MIDIDAVRLRAEGYGEDADIEDVEATLAMMLADILELIEEVERLQKDNDVWEESYMSLDVTNRTLIEENDRFRNPKWVTKPAYLDDPTYVALQGPWPANVDPLFYYIDKDAVDWEIKPAFAELPLLDEWGRKHV